MKGKKLPENPYPGLRPFEFPENHLFFGREGQSEEVLRRLQESRFVAVVGTSGSGKSSLVRAGLLPLLFGGLMNEAGARWRVALFRPGDDPIHNLAAALVNPAQFISPEVKKETAAGQDEDLSISFTETILRRSAVGLRDYASGNEFAKDENLLIVVDQFEELFRFKKEDQSRTGEKSETQQKAENEASAFVKLLLEAARDRSNRVYIIITMRSDFLGDCSQFRDLPEIINEGQYLIPRLTTEQLRKVIEAPARVKKARIEPALVARLLNDIGDDQDQLPVLQHALMRTWEKWVEEGNSEGEINFDSYNATGGMATALSIHANEAYDELGDAGSDVPSRKQKIAEKLFKCLTETDRENRETRRATPLGSICAIADAGLDEVASVIDVFRRVGRTFLMPPISEKLDENTVIDISHESLIRKWDKLRVWVEEEAQASYTYRRLSEDARLHQKGKAPFWSDPQLADALHWKEEFKPNETWAELYYKTWGQRYLSTYPEAMDFLEASRVFRENELLEEEAQRNREIEQERRLREIESEKALVLERSASKLRRYLYAMAVMSLLFLFIAGVAGFMYLRANKSESAALRSKEEAEAATNREFEERRKTEEQAKTIEKNNEDLRNKEEDLKDSLTKQKEETEKAEKQEKIAREQTRQAQLNEAEKEKAFEEQKRLKIKADVAKVAALKAREDAVRKEKEARALADRESLNRTALTDLEQGENEKALKGFTSLFESYDTEERTTGKSQETETGRWWALHNQGIANSRIGREENIRAARDSYLKALEILGEPPDQTKISGAQGKNPVNYVWRSVSYQANSDADDKREKNRSKVATLRRLAQLYREQAQKSTVERTAAAGYNIAAIKKYNRLLEILEEEHRYAEKSTDPVAVDVELSDGLDAKLLRCQPEICVELADSYTALDVTDLDGTSLEGTGLDAHSTDDDLFKKAAFLYGRATLAYSVDNVSSKTLDVAKKYSDMAIKRRRKDAALGVLEDTKNMQEADLPVLSVDLADTYNRLAKALQSVLDAPPVVVPETGENQELLIKAERSEIEGNVRYFGDLSEEIYYLEFKVNKSKVFSETDFLKLANMYSEHRNCKLAEKVYLEGIKKGDGIVDEKKRSFYLVRLWASIAKFYQTIGRLKEASAHFDKAYENLDKMDDKDISEANLSSFANVAEYYAGKGGAERSLIRRSLNLYKKILAAAKIHGIRPRFWSEDYANSKIADSYELLNDYAEAEKIRKGIVDKNRKTENTYFFEGYRDLADFYFRTGQRELAVPIYKEVIKHYEPSVDQYLDPAFEIKMDAKNIGDIFQGFVVYVYAMKMLGKLEEKENPEGAKGLYKKAVDLLDLHEKIRSKPQKGFNYTYFTAGALTAGYYKDRAEILESWSKLLDGPEASAKKAQADDARREYRKLRPERPKESPCKDQEKPSQ